MGENKTLEKKQSETGEVEDGLLFWRKALNDPAIKANNINYFISKIFEGVAQLDDSDAALATVFSEVDTHDLIGKLWKGVGKLDDKSARTIGAATSETCARHWKDRDIVLKYLDYDIDKPSIAGALAAHQKIECSCAEGDHARVVDQGDGTAIVETASGDCVCMFYKIYGLIEPNHALCHCTRGCLESFYGALLGKHTPIEVTQSVARGAKSCIARVTLPSLD